MTMFNNPSAYSASSFKMPMYGSGYENSFDLMDSSSVAKGGFSGMGNIATQGPPVGGKGLLDGMTGMDIGKLGLGTAQSLMGAFMGMKNYGLAKKTFNESKRQFAMNFDANRQATNSRMEDRQAARVASNAGAYESVGDYMNKNRIA